MVIKRPIAEVFEFMANNENNPQWGSGTIEVRKTSEGPIGVGTTFTSVSQLLGRRLESTTEYTEYEPNKKIGVKSISGPIPFKAEFTFDSIAEAETKVTAIGEGDVGGFFNLAEPLVARRLKKQFETDNANLKDLLEAQG